MEQPKKILIIRNDKLGDFMLAYPTFNTVKKLFPEARIYALVPEYTKPMSELCEWIDEIVDDDKRDGFTGLLKTTSKLKSYNFDAALCLHSTPRIALSLFLAAIPHRFAPASRIDQVFYNHRLTQRRSQSEKPEFEYNIDLANFMGGFFSQAPAKPDGPPYLNLPSHDIKKYRQEFFDEHHLKSDRKIVIVHAGTGGSAINLNIKQYAELITLLAEDKSLFFILTAGPGEENIAHQISSLIQTDKHTIHISANGLKNFSKLLAIPSFFISGSTGILHIAGTLNIPTVAFYPKRRSATSLRWKTLNSESKQLIFTLEPDNDGEKTSINLKTTSQSILNWSKRNHISN